MGWFDDEDESGADESDVVRADPRAAERAVDAVTSWMGETVGSAVSGVEEQVMQAVPEQVQTGWDTSTDWVREQAAAVDTEVVRIGDDLAAEAGDAATEFAHNAETQFTNDPVEFVGRATGAPHIDYDTDSSDGTLGLHVDS